MATVEEERPASSISSLSVDEEVSKLMSQGKRHFVCNQIVEAVKNFQEACRLLGEKYGQTSNECGDAYFYYGKSLFELARVENGVLGNALTQVPLEEANSEDEEKLNAVGPKIKDIPLNEREDVKQQVQSAMEEKETEEQEEGENAETSEENKDKATEGTGAVAAEEKAEKEEADEKMDTEKEEKKEDNSVETKEADESETVDKVEDERTKEDEKIVDNEKENNDKDEGDEEEKDGDEEENDQDNGDVDMNGDTKDDEEVVDADSVPTMQLAWEMLELARILFKRIINPETQLKLAQTHLLLGEINIEQDQFSDGISELTKCLNIQKPLLPADDRLLAETYYNMGLAHTLSMNYPESASCYQLAIDVLELRMKNIKNRIEKEESQDKGKSKASEDDPYVKDKTELVEIQELLPEVKAKCLDAKNESERIKTDLKEQLGITTTGFGTSDDSCTAAQPIAVKNKADDVSHLVKRPKRKSEDQSSDEKDSAVKKARQEGDGAEVNGNNATTKDEVAPVEEMTTDVGEK